MKKKPKKTRPRKKASKARTRVLEIRLSDEEYEQIASRVVGQGISTWARTILLFATYWEKK